MPVILQAGNLRNRVRFEQLGTPVPDGAGNETRPWATLCVRYAQIKGLPVTSASSEAVIQGRLTGTAIMTITVRRDAETKRVTTDDRAIDVAEGTVYNIRSAEDMDGDRHWITLTCQKGVAT